MDLQLLRKKMALTKEAELLKLEKEEEEEEIEAAPPKVDSWFTASLVVLAYQIGVGIMSLPLAFVNLGYLLGTASIFGWMVLSIYVGIWMQEVKATWNTVLSFADVSFHAFNDSKIAKYFIGTIVYLNFFLLVGEFVLVQSQALNIIFYDSSICSVVWLAICVAFDIPLQQFRTLSLTFWMMILNMCMIISAVLISLITLSLDNTPSESLRQLNATTSVVVPEGLTIFSFFTSQALISFSFAYGTMTLEVMSEMRDYTEFRKSVSYVAMPLCGSLYLISGIWGYGFLGSSATGLLVTNIPEGPAYRAAGVCLFLHISVTTTISATVLVRALHRAISPSTINSFAFKGVMNNLAISSIMTFLAAGLALGIPIFENLTSLIGSLTLPILAYILPIVFVFRAKQHKREKPSKVMIIMCGMVVIFLLLLTFLGTAGTIIDIVDHYTSNSTQYQYC